MNALGMKRVLGVAATALIAAYAIVANASTQIPSDRTITTMGTDNNRGYIMFTPAVPNLEN